MIFYRTEITISQPVISENYDIDDMSSGDETDDENNPKKPIPDWAQCMVLFIFSSVR